MRCSSQARLPRRDASRLRRCLTDRRGQATVEAAFLIPVIFVGMLMAVEPGLLLYDRIVMQAAASEGCRLLETLEPGSEEQARAYVLRRLDAIPDVDVFHTGAWNVEVEGSAESDTATVRIAHSVRPLPLLGQAMTVFGMLSYEGLLLQEVERSERVRDAWIVASPFGLDERSWIQRWEDRA